MSHPEEFDAHGHKDHGHVIVPLVTLRLILGALLFFTLLTVGAAKGEEWLAHALNVEIPHWANAAVALSIAAVKTTLVVLFFMQLKYDNPLNTMIFVFTLLTVCFFLGFTAMDLTGRGTLDRAKAIYEIDGGSGLTGESAKGTVAEGNAGIPITAAATLVARAKGTYNPHEAHHAEVEHSQIITDAGYLPKLPAIGSSSSLSRPVRGVTIPGLPGYKMPGAEHGHDATPAGEHGAPGAPGSPAAAPVGAAPGEAKPGQAEAKPAQPAPPAPAHAEPPKH